MSGDEPYAGHNGALLILLISVGLVALVWLTISGIRGLMKADATGKALLGPTALLAWDAAVGAYIWGLILLMLHDDYALSTACQHAVGRDLKGYEATFVPLRFGCVTDDGRVVEAAVIPGYINPSVTVCGICALVLTGLVIALHKKGPRT
ncbi:hypothetical protein ACF07S_13990 [Streptomyces sp. NPDC016640]|uniref:hypothetical protein n=1 Tax=Streptomyces sp. NPDC016640 TaxID=3364969 RepID=UPI00370278CA